MRNPFGNATVACSLHRLACLRTATKCFSESWKAWRNKGRRSRWSHTSAGQSHAPSPFIDFRRSVYHWERHESSAAKRVFFCFFFCRLNARGGRGVTGKKLLRNEPQDATLASSFLLTSTKAIMNSMNGPHVVTWRTTIVGTNEVDVSGISPRSTVRKLHQHGER